MRGGRAILFDTLPKVELKKNPENYIEIQKTDFLTHILGKHQYSSSLFWNQSESPTNPGLSQAPKPPFSYHIASSLASPTAWQRTTTPSASSTPAPSWFRPSSKWTQRLRDLSLFLFFSRHCPSLPPEKFPSCIFHRNFCNPPPPAQYQCHSGTG